MKRITIGLLAAMAALSNVAAQTAPMDALPSGEGTRLLYNSYDGNNDLLYTSIYTVTDAYGNDNDRTVSMILSIFDRENNVVDSGVFSATYQGGNFYLSVKTRSSAPDAIRFLSSNAMVMGTLLDYSDRYEGDLLTGGITYDETSYTVSSKDDRKDYVNVSLSDRNFVRMEEITVNAGTFRCAQITFKMEVYRRRDKTTAAYLGQEWYAPGVGVIRTNIMTEKGDLVNYSVLHELRK